jgi:hypothetical protein
MMMLPAPLVSAWFNWSYEAGAPGKLVDMLRACIGDNPRDGRIVRMGQDQCPTVTEELEARRRQIADLQRQLAEAKKAPLDVSKIPWR